MNTAELHQYAWKWFEYHAAQRLTGFRFFVLFFGVLVVAYRTSLRDNNFLLADVVAWFGVFISIAFLVLEVRNEALVNVGREALIDLEEFDESLSARPRLQLLHIDRNRSRWLSHKYWLRAIYVVCGVLFLIGATYPEIVISVVEKSEGG